EHAERLGRGRATAGDGAECQAGLGKPDTLRRAGDRQNHRHVEALTAGREDDAHDAYVGSSTQLTRRRRNQHRALREGWRGSGRRGGQPISAGVGGGGGRECTRLIAEVGHGEVLGTGGGANHGGKREPARLYGNLWSGSTYHGKAERDRHGVRDREAWDADCVNQVDGEAILPWS